MKWAGSIITLGVVALAFRAAACASFGADEDAPVADASSTPADAPAAPPSDGAVTPEAGGESCATGSVIVDASDVADGSDAGKCSLVANGVIRSDNCYWVPDKDPLTFEFANTRCQKPNPKDHIVTIGSAGENDFLVNVFPTCEDRWIGLFANPDGGAAPVAADFQWKNTAPDGYRAWAPGFPTGTGRCVVLRPDGRWENRSCTEVHTVVCERE